MKLRYLLLASVMFTGNASAIPHYGSDYATGPSEVAAHPLALPAAALRQGMDKLLAFLDGERPSRAALGAFLNDEIVPFFDFDYMTRAAAGRLFERLSVAEQQAMVEQVKRSFLGKMVEKLSGYESQSVRFLPPRMSADGRTAQVGIAVLNPGQYPARLDFRMYRDGELWLVYDVSANGQSAIVHFRNQLMRELRRQHMRHIQAPRGYAPTR